MWPLLLLLQNGSYFHTPLFLLHPQTSKSWIFLYIFPDCPELNRWKNCSSLTFCTSCSHFSLVSEHGEQLVRRSLGFITASKTGLTKSELEDILSCDDIVLADEVFKYHVPPIRRLPPSLWTRLRNDLGNKSYLLGNWNRKSELILFCNVLVYPVLFLSEAYSKWSKQTIIRNGTVHFDASRSRR